MGYATNSGSSPQSIQDGKQIESTDKWLYLGNPWESHRPEIAYEVKLGGHTEHFRDKRGAFRFDGFRIEW